MATEMAVNALLYQRARRRGDKETCQGKLRAVQARVAAAEQQLIALKAQAAAYEQCIAQAAIDVGTLTEALKLAFDHNDDDGLSRKTYPKAHSVPWGGLTRTVLAILRDAGQVSADRITDELARRAGLSFADEALYKEFRRQIGRTLKNMAHRGLLQGHHSMSGAAVGIWSLTASGA